MSMQKARLASKGRSGLLPEYEGVAPLVYEARATEPVVELLESVGSVVEKLETPIFGYRITLGDIMPKGIIAVHLNDPPHLGLRLESEPPFPIEYPDYWRQVDFTPCPDCGAPVVWHEAAYVSGYRICSKPPYHHSQASRS